MFMFNGCVDISPKLVTCGYFHKELSDKMILSKNWSDDLSPLSADKWK